MPSSLKRGLSCKGSHLPFTCRCQSSSSSITQDSPVCCFGNGCTALGSVVVNLVFGTVGANAAVVVAAATVDVAAAAAVVVVSTTAPSCTCKENHKCKYATAMCVIPQLPCVAIP